MDLVDAAQPEVSSCAANLARRRRASSPSCPRRCALLRGRRQHSARGYKFEALARSTRTATFIARLVGCDEGFEFAQTAAALVVAPFVDAGNAFEGLNIDEEECRHGAAETLLGPIRIDLARPLADHAGRQLARARELGPDL